MVHRARKGLLIAGLITFGVSWGLTVLVSASLNDSSSTTCVTTRCQDAADLFWIPFAGRSWPTMRTRRRQRQVARDLVEPRGGGGATMTIIGMNRSRCARIRLRPPPGVDLAAAADPDRQLARLALHATF
jgi:hypothetical protein